MPRRLYLALLAAMLVLLPGCIRQRGYAQIGGYAQGGTWTVKYNTAGVKPLPAEVQRGVEEILADIDRTLSGYNHGSELSRLNAGDTIVPSPMLIGLYNRSQQIWEQTGGAFDVAAGPLFDIWGFGFKSGEFPDDAAVSAALAVSGMGRLVPRMEDALLPDGRLCASRLLASATTIAEALDGCGVKNGQKCSTPQGLGVGGASKNAKNDAAPSASPLSAIPQLNFNAIAQGYSCDTVASYLSKLGVRDMLVDIGEILCRGVNASGKPWRVGVDRPTDGNFTPGADLDGYWESAGTFDFQGIVTSGNYRKFYVRDGVKYAHTIDPRTGRPAENSLLSATIVAPTAEEADALATYCMVIGLDSARNFIESQPSIEGYLIFRAPDGSMSEWASPGF